MAPVFKFITSCESKKKEPRYACLSQTKSPTLMQNVGWGFLLSTTLSSSGVVTQPHGIYMSSQGVMSGKKASSNPELCPIKGQLSVPCSRARARNQFSSLSPNTTRTMPPCQMLVIHPALNPVIDILTIGPQGRLRSYLLPNRTAPCNLVGDFISS